jgi:hypothetical protein
VFWVWSLEAQVYALGFLGLSMATMALFQPDGPEKWRTVGLAHAFAVCGHIFHLLWALPALYWLWKTSGDTSQRRKNGVAYVSWLLCGVLVPYVLVTAFVIIPRHPQTHWVMRWLLGSAALSGEFHWIHSGWKAPLQWAYTTLRLFWGSLWPYHRSVPVWCWVLTGISAAGYLTLFGRSLARKADLKWRFSMLWLGVYAVFFWTWQPWTECYRMTDIIPLAILLALGLQTIPTGAYRTGVILTVLLTTAAVNFATRIEPMNRISENALYQDVHKLSDLTPENSIYLTLGGSTWIYLLYFTGRTALDLHSDNNTLRVRGDHSAHGAQNVYIENEAIASPLARSWIEAHKLEPVGNHLPWMRIQ